MVTQNEGGETMALITHFSFIEKDDVPFAIERDGNRLFRLDGRPMEKWVEITDSYSRCRIFSNSSEISESEAMLLASELAADIAASQRQMLGFASR